MPTWSALCRNAPPFVPAVKWFIALKKRLTLDSVEHRFKLILLSVI